MAEWLIVAIVLLVIAAIVTGIGVGIYALVRVARR